MVDTTLAMQNAGELIELLEKKLAVAEQRIQHLQAALDAAAETERARIQEKIASWLTDADLSAGTNADGG